MHLFRRQAVADPAAAARTIPVIDYGPYFAGAAGALEPLAAQVKRACEEVGFFYALNHGVWMRRWRGGLRRLGSFMRCRWSRS
ncbi:MAG TPA: 2-oxoglutarate and iron-dependent oxygenase domain-containing protein [Acetobacteraceae bacterium]|nr:2-oxoglutarate and iron-dependent oxygenase domain-containing protein [Acetobacteraceae bacterium]